jgi:hemoglobin
MTTAYEAVGGAEGLRRLVDRFYDIMDTQSQAQGIRVMHPENLASSRDKLYLFLSGWLGGPNLYIEKYGHPRLRARHMPFAIGESERDQWMRCMILAMHDMGLEEALLKQLGQAFWDMADFMRNKAG